MKSKRNLPTHQLSSGHRIALYVRVSSEEQAGNPEGSIKSQEQRLRSHVEYRNHQERFGEIVGAYIDRAKSGKDTNRPELQKMLSAIVRGEITHVLVTELSRLSRNIRDFLEMWELMEHAGCQFQSIREQVDTSTAAGRMVIHSMMNFAQFEREQTAERVTANLIARSARGLYNGGIVPFGYKLIQDKKGYLEIDEEVAPTIRMAFEAFLKEETLTNAATWLNKNGYHIARRMRGGGGKPRLGHFTIDNLQFILRNRAYAGIKAHQVKGEIQESKAVWEPMIDPMTFDRVQALLSKNYCRKKPVTLPARYPFWLAGLVHCGTCGDRLSGKSAHGNGGKIPYYEHAWATKRQACLVKKVFDCTPNRVLARKLEPLVWEKVEELLRHPQVAESLIAEAKLKHSEQVGVDEAKQLRDKIDAMNHQLEALAERISQLPKAVPAEPFYKQMQRIQELKLVESNRLEEVESNPALQEIPVELPRLDAFLRVLSSFAENPVAVEAKIKILSKLIHRIEIHPAKFRLHFHVGKNYIEGELANAGSLFSNPRNKKGDLTGFPAKSPCQNLDPYFGSNTLTYGCPRPIVFEPITAVRNFVVQWKKPRNFKVELAKLT